MSRKTVFILFFSFLDTSFYANAQKASTLIDRADSVYYSDPKKSCEFCYKALKKAETEGDYLTRADAQLCIARYYLLKSEYKKVKEFITHAIDQYKSSLNTKDASTNKRRLASAYNLYAILYYRLGQNERSYDYQNEAIRLFKEVDDVKGMVNMMNNLANAYIEDNRLGQAATLLDEIYSYYDRISQESFYFYEQNMGLLRFVQKKYAEALDWFKKALTTAQTLSMRDSEITALTLVGKAYTSLKNYAMANETFQQAEKLASEQNQQYELDKVYEEQAEMLKAQGKNDEAMKIEAKRVRLQQNSEAEATEANIKRVAEERRKHAEKRNELLQKQKEFLMARQHRFTMMLYISLIGGVVIGLIIFISMRVRYKKS
jgi:tetratricopeptide (TPR) repeat protein